MFRRNDYKDKRLKREETAADVSGCVFSVLSQKVKIKTQNELTGHPSASLSVYKDVKIIIKISKQCFEAVKCEYSAFKVPILVLAPGPLFVLSAIVPKVVQKVLQNSFFDRSFSSQVFKSSSLRVFKSKGQVFKSKSRRNHEQKVNEVLAPGPLFVLSAIVILYDVQKVVQKVFQNSFFDQSFSSQVFKCSSLRVFKSRGRVFKSGGRRSHERKVNKVLAPGPLFVLSASVILYNVNVGNSILHVNTVFGDRLYSAINYIRRSSRSSRGSTSRARSAMLRKYYRRPSKPV